MSNQQLASLPLLLSSGQVCDILHVSRPTLENLIDAGTIEPLHVRGLTRRRYLRDAVLRLLQPTGPACKA